MFMSSDIRPAPANAPSLLARSDAAIVLALALFTFLVRGAWIGDPNADIDEQLYSLIGNQMLHGAVPFVDLWDRKPWGLFAIFALAHAIGGSGPEAYQILAAVFTLAGATMTYFLARDAVDRGTAAGAGLLYVLMLAIYAVYSANSEAFFLPLILAMAILVRNPDHPNAAARGLLAMFIGGLALQVKYTVVPQCLFFGLWVIWGQWRRGMRPFNLACLCAAFGVLGILPTALVAGSYAMAGNWDAFVFANFVSFFDRLPGPWGRWPRSIHLNVALFLVGLILGGLNAARSKLPRPWPRHYVFALLWLLASAMTTFLPSTMYLYYMAAMVPGAILVSLPLFEQRPVRRINFFVLMPSVIYLALVPYQYYISHENRAHMQNLADAIAPQINAKRERCLYVFDGPTALYEMTQSCLPTRFIYPDHLNNALERDALGIRQEDEVARILATRPSVIVTADEPVTPQNMTAHALVMRAIERDYRALAETELHKRVVRAWVRRQP